MSSLTNHHNTICMDTLDWGVLFLDLMAYRTRQNLQRGKHSWFSWLFTLPQMLSQESMAVSIGYISIQSMLPRMFSHEWPIFSLTTEVSSSKVLPYMVSQTTKFCSWKTISSWKLTFSESLLWFPWILSLSDKYSHYFLPRHSLASSNTIL